MFPVIIFLVFLIVFYFIFTKDFKVDKKLEILQTPSPPTSILPINIKSGLKLKASEADDDNIVLSTNSSGEFKQSSNNLRIDAVNTNLTGNLKLVGKIPLKADTSNPDILEINPRTNYSGGSRVVGSLGVTSDLIVKNRNVLGELDNLRGLRIVNGRIIGKPMNLNPDFINRGYNLTSFNNVNSDDECINKCTSYYKSSKAKIAATLNNNCYCFLRDDMIEELDWNGGMTGYRIF